MNIIIIFDLIFKLFYGGFLAPSSMVLVGLIVPLYENITSIYFRKFIPTPDFSLLCLLRTLYVSLFVAVEWSS